MKRIACIVPLLILFLAGCAPQSTIPVDLRWASVSGSQLDASQSGEQFYFNIPVDQAATTPAAVPIKIKVSGKVNSGWLRFELRRPGGQPVWNSGEIRPGDYAVTASYRPPAGQTGTYTLGMVFGDNTSALYNLSWNALALSPLVLLPGGGMLLVALAFVLFAGRRGYLGWRYLFIGAVFWILTVALKFAFAIPVNPPLFKALGVSKTAIFSPGNLLAYLYIGALTGIFEAGVAWLILRKIRWGRADWSQAFVFGIGFGVVEALLLGISSFGAGLLGLISPDSLPVPTLAGLARSAALSAALAPVVERLAVILAHIFACVLIFYAIARHQPRWALLAVLYKTLLDIPAGFAAYWGADTPAKLWAIEGAIAVIALVGLWGIFVIARRYPRPAPPASLPDIPSQPA